MLFLTRTERLNYPASNRVSKESLDLLCKRLQSTYWNLFDKCLTRRIRSHHHFRESLDFDHQSMPDDCIYGHWIWEHLQRLGDM